MPVVSISMPEQLLEQLDEFIDDHDYTGRSAAMREGARGLITASEDTGEIGECAVVVATFDEQAEVAVSLSDIRHSHDHLVTANMHSHADEACLEVFVVDGESEEIHSFIARLRAVDGVRSVAYTSPRLDEQQPVAR